jgi:hypothetical protein
MKPKLLNLLLLLVLASALHHPGRIGKIGLDNNPNPVTVSQCNDPYRITHCHQ